jgi:hypothetical protein
MIIPVDVTLKQLRSMTKDQIIKRLSTWLTNNFTKRQLILWLMDIETLVLDPVRTYRTDGQIESESVIIVDTETALQLNRCVTTWSYYPTGEVDEIIIQNYDSNDALVNTKTIKHYTDGRQPTATEG